MEDKDKTGDELINEMENLRHKLSELEESEARLKVTEQLLREGEERYLVLLENLNEGIFVVKDGVLKFVNSRAVEFTGFSADELTSKPFLEFVHPNDREMVIQRHMSRMAGDDTPYEYSFRIIARDTSVKWLLVRTRMIRWEGEITALVSATDITLRKAAEDALKESEETFKQVAENAGEWIWEVDAKGMYRYCSSAVEKILGYSPDELVGQKHFYDLFAPEVREDLKEAALAAFERKETFRDFINPNVHKNGRIIILETSGSPVQDEQGTLLGYRGTDTDITERKKAETAIRQQRDFLQQLIDAIPTPIFYKDVDGRYMGCNRAFESDTGISRTDIVGKTVFEVGPPDLAQIYHEQDLSLLRNPGVQQGETSRQNAAGNRHEVIFTKGTFSDLEGNIAGLVGVILDITERKRVEHQIKLAEEFLNTIVDNLPIAVFAKSAQGGRFILWNKAAETLFGMTKEQVIGKTDYDFFPKEQADFFWEKDRESFASGEIVDVLEEPILTKHLGTRMLHTRKVPVYDKERRPSYLLAISEDITERKKAEKELHESREMLQLVLDTIPVGVFWKDRDSVYVGANRAWMEAAGLNSSEEVVGKTDYDLPWEKDQANSYREHDRKVMESGIPEYDIIESYTRADGALAWANTSKAPLRDVEGNVVGILGTYDDITERKRAEEALRTSEAQLSNAVAMAHLGHWEYDVAKDLFTFNDQFYKIFRTTAEEVGGYKMSSADYARRFVHPDEISVVAEVIRKAIEATDASFSRQLEHRMLYADGEIGYITVRFFIVKDDTGRTIKTYGVNQDITDRKRAEERNVLLAAIVESSDDAIIGISPDGIITSWNKAAEKMYDYKDAEIVGKPISLLTPPYRQHEILQLTDRLKRGEYVKHYETVRCRRDGHEIDVSLTVSPIWNVGGGIFGASTIARDISEQKNLQRQLLQSQKMEAVGILAGGVAHDFNNLLTVVQGFSELLLMEMDQKAPGYSDLLKIQESALRGAELVRNLLAFSRKAETRPRPINLNHEATRIEKLLSRTIPKMIKIELHLEGDLAAVNADPDQMGQVLMNLAVNAEQAMPDGGNLTIATANISLDEGYCRPYPEIHPGDYVLLTVTDTGHGMQKETLEHIFEPFFTTKGVGKGTGLGLAMVYGIVRQHGGLITCDSQPNEGSTFKIYLPAIKEDRIEKEDREDLAFPRGGTETILLVDDEGFVRDLGTKFLTRMGYKVLTAASGPEAVRLYLKEAERISLVILDLIMPEMGGDKCLEEILAIDPDAKIVISSGAVVEGKKKEILESGAKGFVSKPFLLMDMLKTVREILDSV